MLSKSRQRIISFLARPRVLPAAAASRRKQDVIWDCFSFFNELELLELRLHTLNKVVDRFVLVESTKDYMNRPKPLHFQENKGRYAEFLDRIVHVVVDDAPDAPDPWVRENHQRMCVNRGLVEAEDDDVILISDLDEIPRPEMVRRYACLPGVKLFRQDMHYYFFNLRAKQHEWFGSAMCLKKDMGSPQRLRDIRDAIRPGICRIQNGGWHFSFLGGVERIIHKIESFAHHEFNLDQFKSPEAIEQRIRQGRDLFDRGIFFELQTVDDSYPAYLRDNLDRYRDFVMRPQEEQ
jgi:beta-1,4-mannosyl-glycoprotein beta-1,4-N-acetylglucosaminyltransferase